MRNSLYGTKFYGVWGNMKSRCKTHPRYAGRGITVCERWMDFKNFKADMYSTYKQGLTLDRIDNDKGYYKENCRWATWEEQVRNTSHTRHITFKGRTQCMADWAKEINISPEALLYRLKHFSFEKALSPLSILNQRDKELNGRRENPIAYNRKTKRKYYEEDIIYIDKPNNIAEVFTLDGRQTYLVDLRNFVYV